MAARSSTPRGRWSACPAAVLIAAACGPAPPAPVHAPPPPEGAVIRIGPGEYLSEPHWILAQEVDRWIATIALLEPEESRSSWRRKALTNIVLPMRVASAIFPEDRESVRERLERVRARLVAGQGPGEGLALERFSGDFQDVGLDVWGVAGELSPGEWSEVVETVGGWRLVRLVDAPPREEWNGGTRVTVEVLSMTYLRPEDDPYRLLHDARAQLGLRVTDPAWEWILPKVYQYEKPR